MERTELHVNADTWIDQSAPRKHHADSGKLKLDNSSDKRYALVHVPIPGLHGATVHAAKLHLYLQGSSWGSGDKIKCDLLESKFRESETWHTYVDDLPTLPTALQTSVTLGASPADGDHHTIDVTDQLSAVAAGTDPNYGFLLSTDQTSTRVLYSSEATLKRYRPRLTITYSKAGPVPVDLRPGVGASAEKPVFQWTFAEQTEFSLEIAIDGTVDGTGAFVTPDFQSGWQVSEDTELDSSLTAWSTNVPADGDSTNWHVQVKDLDGTISDWSATASYTRHVYGTPAITDPAVDGDSVDATSPDIVWSLTDATQTKFQVELLKPDIPELRRHGYQDYDSGIIISDVTTWEFPSGEVTKDGETYTALVRLWDEFTRDAPAEPEYLEVQREFVYNPTADLDPVTVLTATDDGPTVRLDWTRTSAPDTFVIFKNGEFVEEVDEADAFVSGDDYSWRVYGATPADLDDIGDTWEVRAHDDGAVQDSADNATVDHAFIPKRIWLCYQKESIDVAIDGQDSLDKEIVEDGATFYPKGQQAPVRVTSGGGSFAGTVSGIVDGMEALGDLETIKSVPIGSGKIRLIAGMDSFNVELAKVTISEWPVSQGKRQFQVTIDWVQVGPPWPVA